MTHAGIPAIDATAAGRPATGARPPASATAPAAIAGATIGATTRFTAGETSETRPNPARTSGSVAACAASETPSVSASHGWTVRPRIVRRRSVSGVPQAMSPAVAADESRNPGSLTAAGSATSIASTAHARAVAAAVARPDSRAAMTSRP